MSIKIKLKHSAVNGKAPLPSDLDNGELALNTNAASPAAYIKDSAGNIVKLAGAGAVGDDWTRNGTTLAPKTAGDVVEVSAGTAALPGLTPVGDPNTGIYSPSADQLAVSTAGREHVRVDNAGRILIGTSTAVGVSTPLVPLFTVRTNTISAGFITDRTDNIGGILALAKTRSAHPGGTTIVQDNDKLGEIRFAGADGVSLTSYGAQISGEVDGTPGANVMPGRLVFSTTAAGAKSPTERMRISQDSTIGFGNTIGGLADPAFKMTLKASGILNLANVPIYTDIAAAQAGGLVAGDVFRNTASMLVIVS